ncbi:glycosyltransferase family 4 protein [Halogeometricum limi]|uniref:Glycosyltransferase involved in cell wall bisynthesis n=1 Tax=Halogeometricum limi TaxID=555875 RepID=A0A1I6HTW7_9EURY|nr:glycosyltransferase family 4 protein [Halogeometricum limi]SFR57848.1 Glycosyltransferase involved in cell wall bisynthesis [Halogeometricum limi]
MSSQHVRRDRRSVERESETTDVGVADELFDLDVAMLYFDPHPAHRGFAEAIGADLIDYREHSAGPLSGTVADDVVNGLRLPNYDVCLVEGSVPLYAALVGRAVTDTTVVYLCADHGLYHVGSDDFVGTSFVKSLVGRFGVPAIRRVADWGIDGVVAVSDFAADFTADIVGPRTPVRVAHPYIDESVQPELEATDPDLESTVAVAVGRPEPYKGFDLLVEAWSTVRERHPEAELHLVGAGHPDSYGDAAGVEVHGYVDSLAESFSNASLYVQPSRMDAFPVSSLEAMCAGLPALVTDTVGTRSEVERVDPSMVVEATPSALASGVVDYFDRPVAERRRLSETARERGVRFDEATRLDAFRASFFEVIDEIRHTEPTQFESAIGAVRSVQSR